MKVLQLGVGAVGEVNARVAAQEPEVSAVVLADVDEARVRAVAAKLPPGKAETLVLDASDHAALVRAARASTSSSTRSRPPGTSRSWRRVSRPG